MADKQTTIKEEIDNYKTRKIGQIPLVPLLGPVDDDAERGEQGTSILQSTWE